MVVAFRGEASQWRDAWLRTMTALLPEYAVPGAHLLLWGPPATGKTFAAVNYGLKPGDRVVVITLTHETGAVELRGFFVTKAGTFEWYDGPVLDALRYPDCRLVINELGAASGDTQSFLLGILDDPELVRIRLPNREIVRPANGFRVIATMNEPPTTLPEPLQSRLPLVIHIPTPNPEILKSFAPAVQNLVRNSQPKSTPPEAGGFGALSSRLADADMRTWKLYNTYYTQFKADIANYLVFGVEGLEIRDASSIASA